MTELPKIELWCHEGRSDKIYCVTVEESGGGYVVNFAYGRRGAALNTGTKTSAPVSHAEAVAIYLKLVESKIDTGLRPQLLNPIGEAEAEAHLSSPRSDHRQRTCPSLHDRYWRGPCQDLGQRDEGLQGGVLQPRRNPHQFHPLGP